MIKKSLLIFFVIYLGHSAFSQEKVNRVRQLSSVTIMGKRIFKKEEAGMKKTKVDSLVMVEKINASLSELLSENTPVFIKSHGRGALATASFRGTASSHTQVKWNGININSPMTGMVDFSTIPVYIIDDMSLKHGAASISDQGGGLGGSININNQVDWNKKFGIKYLQGIGSYGTFDEFLQIGVGNKKIQLKTRVYHNTSKNDYTYLNRGIVNIDPQTGELSNPIDTNENAAFTRYGVLQELYYLPNKKSIITAKYWGQWANRTIPRATSYEGPDNANLNKQTDDDHKLVTDWKCYTSKSKLMLRSGYSQKNLTYSMKNHITGVGLIPAIYSVSNQKSFLNTASYTHTFNSSFSMEASMNFNVHEVSSTDTVKNTGYNQNRKELSGFVSLRKNFWKKVNANLMFLQSYIDDSFVPFVPYFGFDYKVFKRYDFVLKGNIARNYHQPSLNDLYWQPGGNPDLKPERGFSMEIGFEYQKSIKNKHLLNAEVTAFRSKIDRWIIWIPSYKGYWEPRNIKQVLSRGVESNISFKGKIKKINYRISGSYALTSSLNYGDPLNWGDESYGKQLVYVPLHSGNALVHFSYKGYSLTYQHNSYSERFTTSSNNISKRDWLYPYFMNNLNVGKKFGAEKVKFNIEFKIYNLFNETYHSILYRPMPGINYMLLLTISI